MSDFFAKQHVIYINVKGKPKEDASHFRITNQKNYFFLELTQKQQL